ncbi:MAG: hypothetical protein RTV31_16215, partial [Candidatus Thorarchaeota archaeon]
DGNPCVLNNYTILNILAEFMGQLRERILIQVDDSGNTKSEEIQRSLEGPFVTRKFEYDGDYNRVFGLPTNQVWGLTDGTITRSHTLTYSSQYPKNVETITGDSVSIKMVYEVAGPRDPGSSGSPVEYILHDGTISAKSEFKYDDMGRLLLNKDPMGRETNYQYKPQELRIGYVYGSGVAWQIYKWDIEGNLEVYTNPIGHISKYSYDDMGRLVSIENPNGNRISLSYTEDSVLVIDELDNQQVIESTGFGFVKKYHIHQKTDGTYELRKTDELRYDGLYRQSEYSKISKISPVNQIRTYYSEFDLFDRVLSFTNPYGGKYSWVYDDTYKQVDASDPRVARKIQITGPLGESKLDYRGPLGFLLCKKVATKYTTSSSSDFVIWVYWWDSMGRIEKIREPTGEEIRYEYDELGQLRKMTDQCGFSETYVHDLVGQLIKFTDRIGNSTTYKYDMLGQLIKIKTPKAGGVIEELVFDYDSMGRIVLSDGTAGKVYSWRYFDTPAELTAAAADPNIATLLLEKPEIKHLIIREGPIPRVLGFNAKQLIVAEMDADAHCITYEYDGMGNPISTTDWIGLRTSYEFNDFRELTSVSSFRGPLFNFSRNVYGQIESITDAGRNTTTYRYDTSNRLIEKTLPLGNTYKYTYTPQNTIETIQLPLGETWSYERLHFPVNKHLVHTAAGNTYTTIYDKRGLVSEFILPNDAKWAFSHDPNGNLIQVKNPLGGIEKQSYDERNRMTTYEIDGSPHTRWSYKFGLEPTTVATAGGHSTKLERDILSRLTKIIDPYGNTTKITYDKMGRIYNVQSPKGHVTIYRYTPDGLLNKIIHPPGFGQREFLYDGMRRLYRVRDEDGLSEDFTYDEIGQLIKHRNPKNVSTEYRYDSNGALLEWRTSGVQLRYQMTYDLNGRIILIRNDPLGQNHWTAFKYDSDNRLKTILDIIGTKRFSYDTTGTLKQITDCLGKTFTYTHNDLGQLLSYSAEGITPESFKYDSLGRVVARTSTLGEVKFEYSDELVSKITYPGAWRRFEYDKLGRISKIDYNGLYSKNYKYDADGNLIGVKDSDGATATLVYDDRGRLTSENVDGNVIDYDLSRNGRVMKLTTSLGDGLYKYYPGSSLLKTVEYVSTGDSVEFVYDSASRITTKEFSTGSKEITSYNNQGLVFTRNIMASDGSRFFMKEYEYDSRGNLLEERSTNALGSITTTNYKYDANSQLLLIYQPSISSAVILAEHSYDTFGNILSYSKLHDLRRYSYDLSNHMTEMVHFDSLVEKRFKIETDPIGKIRRIHEVGGSYDEIYEYDYAHRLKRISNTEG